LQPVPVPVIALINRPITHQINTQISNSTNHYSPEHLLITPKLQQNVPYATATNTPYTPATDSTECPHPNDPKPLMTSTSAEIAFRPLIPQTNAEAPTLASFVRNPTIHYFTKNPSSHQQHQAVPNLDNKPLQHFILNNSISTPWNYPNQSFQLRL